MSRHLLRSCLFSWLMLSPSPQLLADDLGPLRQNLGPVEKHKTYQFALNEPFVTFKVQTFAETQDYRITCDAPAGWTALVEVRGPVVSAHNFANPPAPKSEFGTAHPQTLVRALQGDRIRESIALPPDGVYELHVSWQAIDGAKMHGAGARLQFAGACLRGCTRPTLGLDEALDKLQASGQSRQLLAQIETQLAAIMPELPEVRQKLLAQWDAALASGDTSGLRRFPTLPVTSLTQVKELTAVGALAIEEAAPVGVIQDSLDHALAQFAKGHSWPSVVPLPQVPYEVRYGNFPNLALTDEQVANSHALAKILNALAEGNGSWIDFDGKRLTTPVDLMRQLMGAKDAKHRVRLKQPKAYANFLSFAIGEYDLRMPIWIDSGLYVAGKALVVPAGHSEHTWWIDGPLVNARIAFYLGTRGAAFLPSTVIAAGWVGERIHDAVGFSSAIDDQEAHEQMIAESFAAAVAYFQRLRLEEKSLGLKRGLGTYGCLGVCNDSDCAVELLRKGCYSSYPLVRDSALSLLPDLALPQFGIEVALKLATLPNDSKPEGPRQRREVLRRILNMAPHPLTSADYWFDMELFQQMKEIESELAEARL